MIPTPQLSRFEVRDFLGRGALGDVYLARDLEQSRDVALKVVRTAAVAPDLLDAEKNGALLQQRLASISPQVPAVFAFAEEEEFFWISMEYIEGGDLAEALQQGPIPEDRALRIAVQLCEFLVVLHGYQDEIGGRPIRGIVHGDLKPQNIRLQADDRVYVLDFGIARQLSLSRSWTHHQFGSLPYIPPERLSRGEVNSGSDLWAVGVILYFLVSGDLPFAGGATSEVEHQILRHKRRPLPAQVSPAFGWIISRCLQPQESLRYASAEELTHDLQALREGRSYTRPNHLLMSQPTIRTTGAPPAAPAISVTIQEVEAMSRSLSSPQRPSRRRTLVVLGMLLLLLVAYSQVYLRAEARELRRSLLIAESSDVDTLWQRFSHLQRFDPFGIVSRTAGESMKEVLTRTTDQLLQGAHSAENPIPQEEWDRAIRHLSAVLALDGAGVEYHSRLAFCRGHRLLAEAHSLEDEGESVAAQRKREEAISHFTSASELDPRWPEPQVSLALIYAKELPDLHRLEAAITEAERRGYEEPHRLAGYRVSTYLTEGERLYSLALSARGSDRERDLLAEAIQNLSRAIDLADRLPGDPETERHRANAVRRLAIVENRYLNLDLPW